MIVGNLATCQRSHQVSQTMGSPRPRMPGVSNIHICPPAPIPSHSTANLRLCVFTRVWQSSPHVLSSHILGLTSHVHPCRLLGFPLTESIQTSQDSRPNMPPFLQLHLYTQNIKGQIFYLTRTQFELLQ